MNDWEKEFDKKFVGEKSGFGDYLERSSAKQIKKFIQSQLTKATYEATQAERKIWYDGQKETIQQARLTLIREIKQQLEGMNFTFEEVNWGGVLTSTEPVEDKDVSLKEAESFNKAIQKVLSLLSKLEK